MQGLFKYKEREKRESFIIRMNKQIKAIDKNYILIKHLGNLVTKKAKGIEMESFFCSVA